MKINYNKISISNFFGQIGCMIMLLVLAGCNKALELPPPPTKLAETSVFTSDANAIGVMAGVYSQLAGAGNMYNGLQGLSIQQGLAADELVSFSAVGVQAQFYTNSLNTSGGYYWVEIFKELYLCNAAIKGLTEATQLTPAVRQQLLGEAKFLRAFIYFNSVNLYGNMPLVTSTDYVVNNSIATSPGSAIYQQIMLDLKDAQDLLGDKYITGTGASTTERIRPNKQVIAALLAKIYLYQKDWVNAETQATTIIGNTAYTLEPDLNQVFLKTSKEAIWQLQPVSSGYNNADGQNLVVTQAPADVVTQFPLSSFLLNAFEPGDARFTKWVGKFNAPASGTIPAKTYYFANKYKIFTQNTTVPVTEYINLLRLADQYLIRAEARAQQGNISGAQSDLNAVRLRAGLPATVAAGKADLLTAIAHERQIELFTEIGNRWFDLKRTGTIDAVMSTVAPQKGGTWASFKQLMPVPTSEITINPHLIQTPGY